MHFIPLAIDKKTEATTVITFNYMNDTPRKRKQRNAPHKKSVFFPWCVCEKTRKKWLGIFFIPLKNRIEVVFGLLLVKYYMEISNSIVTFPMDLLHSFVLCGG